ncbi:MAG TPA: FAD-binding oxidoreductase [Actinomycetota bacterium]|nr:FAD-binding oxidoreductase [Actinomycetota bacterium]
MDRNCDANVVVVGAGILGCSIAVHLVDRGVRPVLIDPERPGQGTSTGSFASISAFGKDPAAWFQLACAGMSGWPRFAGRIGGDVGLRRAGEVRFTSDPEEGRRLARQVADARGRGYPVRLVDPEELARLLPEARAGEVAAACFAPNDGQVEPPLVLTACRTVLEEAGARFVTGRARVQLDDDSARVEVGSEVLRPRTCVLAAGAEAVHVAAAVGLEVPTLASPGMLAQTRPLAPLTDRVVYLPGGPGTAVHLRQRADGSVLVGERTQETPATNPGLEHARALLAQAARFFPALAGAGVDKWWVAWRAMPSDRLPIVGPLPWLEGLYLAVSHSGVTVAPALGRLVADEVATQAADGLLAPFRPGRFAERATRVMLEVESVFREPTRQDRST